MNSNQLAAPILRWSTDAVPAQQRFDYFADALGSAIVPMHVDGAGRDRFAAHMSMTEIGEVAVVHQLGLAHRSYRRREDISHSGEDSFHLIVNRTNAWTISHRDDVRLAPGEVFIADSRYGHDLSVQDGFDIVHLKLGCAWARRWMPRPEAVVGRRIGAGSAWGPALAAFVAGLTPQSLASAGVPSTVLIDQVGAMISLVAAEMGGHAVEVPRDQVSLRIRIHDCMAQRCGEPALDAAVVATALRIDEPTVHAALAAAGETFTGLLTTLRIDVSIRMLRSRAFRQVSVGAIAERAGFPSSSVLARALRRHCGMTAARLRLDADN